jgi:hypothetical protein
MASFMVDETVCGKLAVVEIRRARLFIEVRFFGRVLFDRRGAADGAFLSLRPGKR